MSRYRLIGAPIVESTLLGTLAGATAQLLLPGASVDNLVNGVVPGFALGLVAGVLLAGVTHHVDGKRSDLRGHAAPSFPLVAGACVLSFFAMAAATSNPQISWPGRIVFCAEVATASGWVTYRALRSQEHQARSVRSRRPR
ncbi:hypothetical protein O2W18_18180 [Modestobacter sp. VKM Ac-2983]|uniref:hypothetical protein n=1 Tax=Modestobacter sp. VKM Ac-2983 TaxID=3004137 RepID=UPI0022ABC4EF|nr:hypothetical protein [Modestobacter sp. VKM Ac-2983]MCZ2807039.1 hypothetical protein [Modestobacter sp. VKM Ac-2983]